MVLRHRPSIQDAILVLGAVLFAGFAAWEFSLTGSINDDKRIEFQELLFLGAIVVAGVFYFGGRRIRDQEREIDRRIVAERRAHELAHTDPLTGLANRRQFERTLRAAISTPPGSQGVHALLMLDLNGFKKINDVYGHSTGDELLFAVAERVQQVTREHDLLARLGGDEFAMLAHHLAGPESAMNIAIRILRSLEAPIQIRSVTHRIELGIGIALIPTDGTAIEEILRKADIALYRSKAEARSAVRFFEPHMDQYIRERDAIERDLASVIGTNALQPWYQPILDMRTGDVIAFEALARWSHPLLGDIAPDRFIPIAENCGLINELSDWLLRCACRDALSWPDHVMLSFNISPAQLKDRTLGLRILAILGETGLAPQRLEIELTESALVRDLETAKEVLSSLHDAGISIALDDFGTGYSSLYHLRNFKFDKIKIDRSFIGAMGSENESAAIVKALIGLGAGLGLAITAEGIEQPEQRDSLLLQGCKQGQGFLFSHAIPARQTSRFIRMQKTTKRTSAA